jgi:hypothetical protein
LGVTDNNSLSRLVEEELSLRLVWVVNAGRLVGSL